MTRGAMKVRIAQLLGLSIGDTAFGDPFAIDNALNRVTDEFAGPGMDCYWTSETGDITSGTAEACAPSMYKLKGAYWLDSTSKWQPLYPSTPQKMDRTVSNWRNDPSASTLQYIVFEGVNRFVLYPTPNFTTAGGLKFEGYAQTNVSGISTWAADTAECPLPTWCHEAIVYGAAIELANTMLASDLPTENAKATRVLPVLEGRYKRLRGQAESAASTFYQDVVRAGIAPSWAGWMYI